MVPAVLLVALTQPPAVPNPDWVGRLVLDHKAAAVRAAVARGVSPDAAAAEVSHWYYLSWHGWPQQQIPDAKRFASWWLNNLHFAADAVEFRDVPGSGGLVWWFDRREPDWSADALSAVYRRDVVFRQPAVGEKVAAALRESVGRKVDPKTLHVEAVAWAPLILRDTLESQRNPSYYDLLFSRQRFGAFVEHKDPKHKGWYSADGGKSWTDKPPKADPNFPATLEDWGGFWERKSGAKASTLGKPVELAHGAVVAGYGEDAEKGSFVGRAGRAVKIVQGDFGPVMETYDVVQSTGEQDLLEFAPRLARGEDPKGTFGETLSALPAGGQAAALWTDKGARVEIADGNIARGPPPLNKACRYVFHPQVRNPVDCVRCHALANGLIEPRDLVRDVLDAKADLKFADPADVLKFRGFYGRLKERIPGYQASYKALIDRTTKGPDGKAWTPRELVMGCEAFVDSYDAPVGLERAAAELGVTAAVAGRLSAATLTARPKALLRGIPCPRPTWDADVRPALLNVLVSEYPGEIHAK